MVNLTVMELTNFTTISNVWAFLLVEACVRQGLTRFCIAPGSRSTPLVCAIADHPDCEAFVHVDERGLGFFALGLSRSLRSPVGVITTSGTAVGNLLPAVMEASASSVPLVLLTADRPAELVGVGANQAVDQLKVFGGFVRDFVQLAVPSVDVSPNYVTFTMGV